MEGSALHGWREDVELVLLGLFMWIVIAISVAAAWFVSRSQAQRTADKRCRQELRPFDEWREVFVEFLSQRNDNKTGE